MMMGGSTQRIKMKAEDGNEKTMALRMRTMQISHFYGMLTEVINLHLKMSKAVVSLWIGIPMMDTKTNLRVKVV